MDFQPKNLKLEMVLDSIYVNQYHLTPKQIKNSTNNLNLEIHMQNFKLCGRYYFVINIFYILKIFNVYWIFLRN
jgi:hypothetical protein